MLIRALSNALSQSQHSQLSQNAQNKWIETINSFELKSGGTLQHTSSGGARTYLAYFKQLGLIFERSCGDRAGKKSTFLTLAGQEIADLLDPAAVIRRQVLRMQFPSPYSLGSQVAICESVRIRPSIFVIDMLADKRLKGVITTQDVAIACVYGRTHADLQSVIENVKARRHSNQILAGS